VFLEQIKRKSFLFHKNTLRRPYSLNDCPLLRSTNRKMRLTNR